MKNKKIFIGVTVLVIIVISVFCFKGRLGTTGTEENQETGGLVTSDTKTAAAKSAYNAALKEAKKFSSDSYLVDMDTTGVQSDGKSETWYIYFYSPSKNTNLKVFIVGGKVDRTEEKDVKKRDQITGEWVDSTIVAKIAVPKCNEEGQYNNPDYFINLDAGKNNEAPMWNMNCLVGENKTFKVYINAETGEFIKTGKAGIGW